MQTRPPLRLSAVASGWFFSRHSLPVSDGHNPYDGNNLTRFHAPPLLVKTHFNGGVPKVAFIEGMAGAAIIVGGLGGLSLHHGKNGQDACLLLFHGAHRADAGQFYWHCHYLLDGEQPGLYFGRDSADRPSAK